jgi:hypothetical protein
VGTFKVPKFIRDMAKAMDTPEMRELYRRQKELNPGLDHDCEELGKEIEDHFEHLEDSFSDKK